MTLPLYAIAMHLLPLILPGRSLCIAAVKMAKRSTTRSFAVSMLLLLVGFAPASATTISPRSIRETLATYVRAHPYAMVALGVVDHGRETTYFIRGSEVKARLNERTQFQIGSITKLFTATVLAQMVDAGQVKLSDSIQRYLPTGVTAPTYHGKSITLLSLATHMSGLPGDPANLRHMSNPQAYSVKMLDDALSQTKLTRAPGARWDYSNFGFAILGQILGDKAHTSYDDLIKERILDPLGMRDTVVTGSPATRRHMAPAFEYGGAPTQPESMGAIGPAGSIESDLADMMLFLRANLDAPQGRLGRELAFAQKPRTEVPEWNMTMGLAWQTVLPPMHHIPGDLGDLPAGWLEKGGNTDGYSSFIGLNHACGCGFVTMTNVNDNDFQQVIAHAFSPSTARMPVLWALVKPEPSSLSGKYVITTGRRMTLDFFKYGGDLYLWIPAATTPLKLTPISKNRYSSDELQVTFTFHTNRDGRATGLTAVQWGRTMRAKKIL